MPSIAAFRLYPVQNRAVAAVDRAADRNGSRCRRRRSEQVCAHGGMELACSRAEGLAQRGLVLREAALAEWVRAEQFAAKRSSVSLRGASYSLVDSRT
jgi:hypothetical protein